MEIPKLIDSIYRDEKSTREMTDYALEAATEAAIDQGHNPDKHPVVQALARRALKLDAKARRMEATERSVAVSPQPVRKQPKQNVDPSIAHIIAVAREASGPIAHEPDANSRITQEGLPGVPVTVNERDEVLTPVDLADHVHA
jgi:hypothetical protein